jgi:ubiquinone/menaquinone biosynthesis C-methylase UbiE
MIQNTKVGKKMEKNKLRSPTIYIQAAIALLIIQLVHKIVREIPGAIKIGGPGAILTTIFAGLLVISILLLVLRNKWGLILGMIDGVFMIFQPILVHIILAYPDQNGVWWYPIFPWIQAILIIYFSFLVLRNENKYSDSQKPMSWFAFKIMTLIMSIRKKFRNIEDEISLAGINAGDYILDFGCGLGLNTIPAAQKVKKEGKVFALDISPQAIEIVKDKARKNELKNIGTILSDCNTKLEDKSIDIVYLHNTLPLVRDKENVLSEIHRVLKIGGRLSYLSRAISRSYGEDTIDAEKLKKLLVSNNKYKLSKEKNGHLIFEKIG